MLVVVAGLFSIVAPIVLTSCSINANSNNVENNNGNNSNGSLGNNNNNNNNNGSTGNENNNGSLNFPNNGNEDDEFIDVNKNPEYFYQNICLTMIL